MSDPFEKDEYLSPDFDSQNLRVAELRRIFFEHSIEFKSTAKKAELVQIFNDQVKPRAAQLLRAKLNPAPSTNKIENVGIDSPIASENASPSKTPGKRGPGRQRKHALPDEEGSTEPALPPLSTVKRGPGRPRKVPKTESEDEIALQPAVTRSTRKSPTKRKSANVKVTESEDEQMTDDHEDSPAPKVNPTKRVKKETEGQNFSSENPFQSGSSPAAASSPVKRRQTAVPNSTQKLAPPLAKEPRRKTEGVLTPQSLSSPAGSNEVEFTFIKAAPKTPRPASAFRKSERFMPPVDQLKASPAFQTAAQRKKENNFATSQLMGTPSAKNKNYYDVDTGEEFTPEEAATLPASRKKLIRKHKGPSTLNQIMKWTSLLALSGGSAYGANWYRQEKIRSGYCGIDSDPVITQAGASGVDDIVNQLRPQCVPCPPHATCYPGFNMSCDDEFEKVNSPLSFGGLIPIAPECSPDTEKLRKIQLVADEIVETLRDRTASVECGYTTAPEDGNVGMSASELKDKLVAKKSQAVTLDQFNVLFDHAIEDVKGREEVEVSSGKPSRYPATHAKAKRLRNASASGEATESSGSGSAADTDLYVEDHYHSTSLANISISCSIRHSFSTILARYRVELVGLLTMALLSLGLKNFFESRSSQKLKVQSLVSRVYDELSTTKAKSLENPTRFEPHLGVSQLRDSILADEFSYSSRDRLWQEVQRFVEGNSNVRATQAEIQGEWLRAWEWVGPVRERTVEEKRREIGLLPGDEIVKPLF